MTAEQQREIPWFVSVDDHVVEPPDVWTSRLPAKYSDRWPRYERLPVGTIHYDTTTGAFVTDEDAGGVVTDVWCFENIRKPIRRHIAAAGLDRSLMDLNPISFDQMRKGCYNPVARLADMDLNHVEASLCFPQMSRFCGQEFSETEDKELGLLCIKAYNDWMVDEWCATDRRRLVPLIIVPLWDPELAVAELLRNAERGVHAVSFSENPYTLGFGSIHSGHWDPFFRACAESEMTVCMHIGSSSQMQTVSPDAPPAVGSALTFNNASASMCEFLFSGVLWRFPGLKLAYSESQAGWIPYALERADTSWRAHRAWNGMDGIEMEAPSFYYYRQIFSCVFSDFFAMQSIAEVGEDNVTFEVDYPHTDSTYPDTLALAAEMFASLTDEQAYKVSRGNAIRMLHLDLDKA